MAVPITRSPDDPITRSLQVLYVAYPLLTVSESSAGGAEQVLWTLERELARSGVQTTVAASAGSRVSGELLSTGQPCTQPDDFERRNLEHQERALAFLRRRVQQGRPFDFIHDHSGSFWPRAAEIPLRNGSSVAAPLLATLHLPRHFYPPRVFENIPANVSFNCVSKSQAPTFDGLEQMTGVVTNGIALDCFAPGRSGRSGLLWLGRMCEEKAPHLALEIARAAGMPITLASQIYPFSYHQQYFSREVEPRLKRMQQARFLDSPSPPVRRKLLGSVQAVLLTSQVDETSSLVAMEAAASGTPVVAFRRGALPEIVQEGVTGFLVNDVDGAVQALRRTAEISPETCRQHARKNFSGLGMALAYVALYERVLSREVGPDLPLPGWQRAS
ncbi:MAG TPA: glycosyltransferase [Candidatus Angelobacter sp.]